MRGYFLAKLQNILEYTPFYNNFVTKIMRRLKKKYFIATFCGFVIVLASIKWTGKIIHSSNSSSTVAATTDTARVSNAKPNTTRKPNRIYSVPSFSKSFPDLQETQIISARKWGVKPVRNREEAEKRKKELVFIGSNPYYKIDSLMSSSLPYLVPRAANVLETIARNYLDSLYMKGIPMHKILVSSVLRTEEDIIRLQKINVNASPESCHRFGTTFDIAYNRYHTVSPPDKKWRSVQNDTLKWVLAEVLRDVRNQKLCHIKYEVKQGCFHITVR
jgi:hypothetical protein